MNPNGIVSHRSERMSPVADSVKCQRPCERHASMSGEVVGPKPNKLFR